MTHAIAPVGSSEEKPAIDANDVIIHKTQALRMEFIEQLTPNGRIPEDPLARAAVIQLLNGAAGTAIASKRIKADEKAAESQAAMLNSIVEAATALRNGRAKASAPTHIRGGAEVTDVPVKIVPGHTDIGMLPVDTQRILSDPTL